MVAQVTDGDFVDGEKIFGFLFAPAGERNRLKGWFCHFSSLMLIVVVLL